MASGTDRYIHCIYDDHELFTSKVRELTAFVGMKLHATALATCALTPSVMLEYRPKCRDYMQSIGQEAHTFKTNVFRATTIWELAQSWNVRRADAAKALAYGIQKMQASQRAMAEEISGLILSS